MQEPGSAGRHSGNRRGLGKAKAPVGANAKTPAQDEVDHPRGRFHVLGTLILRGVSSRTSAMFTIANESSGPEKYVNHSRLYAMKTKTHFQFRVYLWDLNGGPTLECVAGTNDIELAAAGYRAALERWPHARVMLRHGARTVHDSGPRSVIA
jgi:hypothetical protein